MCARRIEDYLNCTQSLNNFESIFLLELLLIEDIELCHCNIHVYLNVCIVM